MSSPGDTPDASLPTFVDDSGRHCLLVLDTVGRVVTCDAAAKRIYCLEQVDLTGASVSRLWPRGELSEARLAEILQRSAGSGCVELETRQLRGDGSRFSALVDFRPLYDPARTLSGFALIVLDLTRRISVPADARPLVPPARERVGDALGRARAHVFLQLGHQLNAVRTPEEAARVLLMEAGSLVPWEACGLKLSAEEAPLWLCLARRGDAVVEGPEAALALEAVPDTGYGGVGGVLEVPVLREGTEIGWVCLRRGAGARYSSDDRRILKALVNYGAAALDRTHQVGERAAALTRQLLAFSRRQLLDPQVLRPEVLLESRCDLRQQHPELRVVCSGSDGGSSQGDLQALLELVREGLRTSPHRV